MAMAHSQARSSAQRLRSALSFIQQQQSRSYASASTSTNAGPSNPSYIEPLPGTPKPPVKSWYTGRPALSQFLQDLTSELATTRSTLYRLGYLKSIDEDVRALSAEQNKAGARWLTAEQMAPLLEVPKVRLAHYRRITSLLSELSTLQPFLEREGHGQTIAALVEKFAKRTAREATNGATGVKSRDQGYMDPATGIAYGLGKKKTAVARAWVVPIQPPKDQKEEPPIGKVLVNAVKLPTYFPLHANRTLLLQPFSLTETLGKYNVFILVKGGGHTAQAQAANAACARALASMDPVRKAILSKADLLRRDPRVVERKKTGKPKARKSYTWVKR